ncbi:hypothetical protein DFP72DRAFT_853243 [Ephemerocybe angulata]|uniref:Uncharacterized protein n=1 Tax=Ephemerocybe angulata TaxID=980116 RepID=A0A8H6LZN3_9AGAR|nr:hypothetical protein DFP72DRAFT_853243 [Tulosesus angulatus]
MHTHPRFLLVLIKHRQAPSRPSSVSMPFLAPSVYVILRAQYPPGFSRSLGVGMFGRLHERVSLAGAIQEAGGFDRHGEARRRANVDAGMFHGLPSARQALTEESGMDSQCAGRSSGMTEHVTVDTWRCAGIVGRAGRNGKKDEWCTALIAGVREVKFYYWCTTTSLGGLWENRCTRRALGRGETIDCMSRKSTRAGDVEKRGRPLSERGGRQGCFEEGVDSEGDENEDEDMEDNVMEELNEGMYIAYTLLSCRGHTVKAVVRSEAKGTVLKADPQLHMQG